MALSPVRLMAASALSGVALAQCANPWSANVALSAPGLVYDSTLWDPDGPGPLSPRLVVAVAITAFPNWAGRVDAFDDALGVWQAIGVWGGGQVTAVAAAGSGRLFAGGATGVMEWSGTGWTQLGGTLSPSVACAAVMASGDLVVGGGFTSIGGVPFGYVARWDGASWQPMASGVPSYVDELLVMPNGELVAGGLFGAARWDGVAWSLLGSAPGWCVGLAATPDGDLLGGFSSNRVARWDGTSWIVLPGPVLPSAAGMIEALAVLPNGDVLAADGAPAVAGMIPRLARWDGFAWTAVGVTDGPIRTLTARPGPGFDVVAGGGFASVNGLAAWQIARMTTTCPAAVTTIASRCASGSSTLVAEPPWVGAVWRASASGLPQPSFAVGVYGFSAMASPLSGLIPQAVPGCTLHMPSDILRFLPATNGVVSSSWPLPNLPALAGGLFRHQVVALQWTGGLGLAGAVATDAAELTIGSF